MANAKIMIVESNPLVSEDIGERLKTLGYTICAVAPSGVEAVAKAAETPPDLALVATRLEGEMDGIEVAQEIYNRFDFPVVYLTDYVNEDLLKKVRVTRAFGHVFKPYETNQLHLSIENHLYWYQEDQKFKDQEQQLATILKNIGDAVIVTDQEGRITFMNPVAEQLTDWQLAEAVNASVTEVFNVHTTETEDSTAVTWENILHKGAVVSDNTMLVSKTGREIYIDYNVSPLKNGEGNITGVVLAFHNIAKFREVEGQLEQIITELQEHTQFMETVLNSSNDGIIVVDVTGNILLSNPSIQQLFNLETNDIPPSEWSAEYGIFHLDEETHVPTEQLPLVRAITRGEATSEAEFFIRNEKNPDGAYTSANVIPLRNNENQEIIGAVGIVHNITNRKKTEMQLQQTISKLQDQTRLMETVVNSMNEGLIVSDSTGEKILLTNPSVERMFGPIGQSDVPLSEWSKKYGIFYPDKKTYVPIDQILSTPPHILKDKQMLEAECFIRNERNKDGTHIMSSLIPLFDDNQQITGWVNVIRDITKDKAAAAELTQMMSKLQEQAQLMETVFNSVSDGVVVTNEKGEFLFVNPSATQITGMTATDAPPEEWSEVYGTFYPDKVTPFPSEELPLIHAMQGRMTDGVDLFLRSPENPNGVFINVSGRPLEGEDTVRGGVITFRDVTKIKETEAELEKTVTELQNQTQLMNTVFNSISDGVVVADKDGKFFMFNASAKRMTGQDLQPTEIEDIVEQVGFFLPDEKTPYPEDQLPMARVLRGEMPDHIEMFMSNPSTMERGMYLNVSARPLYDAQGTLIGGVSASRDVTELKQTEGRLKETIAQLEDQAQLMQSVFNSISDGVVVADEYGQFTIFNPSAEKIVGMGATDTNPDDWSDKYGLFFHDKVTPFPPNELPLIRALYGEATDDVEMFVRNPMVPDGVYISASARPLPTSDGGGVVVFRDVTERVLAEEALTQAFAQGRLEIVETILHNIGNAINSVTVGVNVLHENLADNRLIHRFSSVADMVQAHEGDWADYIKNDPKGQQVLPFIVALAEDLTNQNEQLVQTLERVRDRVTHIVDIIRTQKASNQASMVRKNIELKKAILNAVKLQQDSLDKREIQIEVDCENAPQEIRIQESQFHQMLVNLFKNSIEAIDERIRSGGLDEPPRITVKVYIREDFLHIDVTDNGIGISPKNARLIFSAGYTTKKSGTGLGLHSSANFVIGSGGKIVPLSDGIGKGTTMRIMLRCSSVIS